jgi:hypothetical protein
MIINVIWHYFGPQLSLCKDEIGLGLTVRDFWCYVADAGFWKQHFQGLTYLLFLFCTTGILQKTKTFEKYAFFAGAIACLQWHVNTEPLNQNVSEQQSMEK